MSRFWRGVAVFFLALVLAIGIMVPAVALARENTTVGEGIDPDNLCIIAKGNDGKYYGVPTSRMR